LTVIALALGLLAGLGIGLLTAQVQTGYKKALRWLCMGYVAFFRGTPLFVQILLVHFALMPMLIHPSDGLLLTGELAKELRQNYGAFLSGVVALTLNAAAYISEIVRAGIQSISRGQVQAAQSLGMNEQQSMRLVVLPQALRRMVPPLVNESITLLKDSSLVSAIGLAELAMAARTVAGAYSRYWEPYLAISLVYLVLTGILTLLAKRLETPTEMKGR
jgi:polar amino acid transport system permease protein